MNIDIYFIKKIVTNKDIELINNYLLFLIYRLYIFSLEIWDLGSKSKLVHLACGSLSQLTRDMLLKIWWVQFVQYYYYNYLIKHY